MSTTLIARGACAAALSLFLQTNVAYAHHAGGPGNANAAGPINTMSATPLGQDATIAGLEYGHADIDSLSDETLAEAAEEAATAGEEHAHFHSLDAIETLAVTFAHGLSENFTIAARLPMVRRENIRDGHAHEETPGVFHGEAHDLGDVEGIGDLSVLGHWRFLHSEESGVQAAAVFGFEAPTGSTNERALDGEPLDAEFQPGADSWDFLLGGALTRAVDRWSFDASGLYTFAGDGGGANLGDRFAYGVALSRRIVGEPAHSHAHGEPAHSDGASVDLTLELNGEWHGKQEAAGETDPNSCGRVLYLAPGLRASLNRFSGFVSVGLVIDESMNGLQASPSTRASMGAALRF